MGPKAESESPENWKFTCPFGTEVQLNRERDDYAECEGPTCKPHLTSARPRRLMFSVFAMRKLKQRVNYIGIDCGWYVCVLRLGAAGVHGLAADLKLVRNVVMS